MNTLEGNKLIAVFSGLKDPMYNGIWLDSIKFRAFYTEELEFHTSWDWLMPVVEKIERLDTLDRSREFNRAIDRLISLPIYTDISTVYKAVLEFIQWYNLQGTRSITS